MKVRFEPSTVAAKHRQVPVRCERQHPALLVHRSVVIAAERHKVAEIGAPPVAPPLDVVQGAQREFDWTAGNRTRWVESEQSPSLSIVGQTGTPTEFE